MAANPLHKQNIMGEGAQGPRKGPDSGRECLPLSVLGHRFPSVDLLRSPLHSTWLYVRWSRHADRPGTHSLLLPSTLSAPMPNSQGSDLIGPAWLRCPLGPISCGLGWGQHPLG